MQWTLSQRLAALLAVLVLIALIYISAAPGSGAADCRDKMAAARYQTSDAAGLQALLD